MNDAQPDRTPTRGPRTGSHRAVRPPAESRRPPAGIRRSAACLAAAAAGAVLINLMVGNQPPAQAESAAEQSVSVAQQLSLNAAAQAPDDAAVSDRLADQAASRADRESAEQVAAGQQAAADQAVLDARAAAAAQAAADAAAAAAAQAAADAAAAAAAATPDSFQDYAMLQLGGDASEFSCLESLWGRESGWNPNAQNPTSTAYGIPQFLNSTWAGTGIAKTSDGYRQIDAGLIYIDSRYGSPCGAWGHSQSTGWY